MFRYLPEQASEFAHKVDWINNVITDISVFFTVAIVGSMLYFAVKYRAKNGIDHETPHIEGSHFLEVVWTVVPTLVSIFVATYGILVFKEMRAISNSALTINVTGRQWKWDFQYDNGKLTTTDVVIPVDTPVKFVLTAKDVLHSFFVPSMRVKMDAIPGQYTYVSFKPIKTGEYDVFCTEYCGTDHSSMLAKLRVVSKDEYTRWLNDDSEKIKFKPAELGKNLYTEKGCATCHSLDGTPRIGPTFMKIYGKQGTFVDGASYTADENYIREAILNPNAHIVNGFPKPSPMPAFEGLMSDDQISAIIAFFKTLDGSQPAQEAPKFAFASAQGAEKSPVERGKALYTSKACIGCHSLDGSKVIGPSFKGLYGKSESLADGTSVTVNDEYLKNSLLKPNDQIVAGYPAGQMPAFEGQLSDQDIADIIEFIKTAK